MAVVGWVLELHQTPNQVSGWFLRFLTMILKRKIKYPVRIHKPQFPEILNKSNNRPENQWFLPVFDEI
jgi:hypothetical protein